MIAVLKEWTDQLSGHIRSGHMFWRVHHGSQKLTDAIDIQSCNLILTTYHTILAEYRKCGVSGVILSTHWRRVILDEGELVLRHDRDTRLTCRQHTIFATMEV